MKKLIILAALVLGFGGVSLLADPSPFGLELGKASYAEFKDRFPAATDGGISAHSQGKMAYVPSQDIELDGVVRDALFIFDTEDRLTLVQLTFQKGRFDDVLGSLSKYKMVKKVKPFVGNAYAKFRDGGTIIELDAPHLSFEMTLTYMRDEFKKAMDTNVKNEESERKNRQNNAL